MCYLSKASLIFCATSRPSYQLRIGCSRQSHHPPHLPSSISICLRPFFFALQILPSFHIDGYTKPHISEDCFPMRTSPKVCYLTVIEAKRIKVILAHLTSSGSPSSSQSASQDSSMSFERRPLPSGSVKLKTIRKGWTNEGDKLLGYLVGCSKPSQLMKLFILFTQEEGIFDALEKQYLRSFIFAVYLVCLLSVHICRN